MAPGMVRGKSGSETMQEIPTLDFCQFIVASGSNQIHSVSSSVGFRIISSLRSDDMIPLFLASLLCRIIVFKRGNFRSSLSF